MDLSDLPVILLPRKSINSYQGPLHQFSLHFKTILYQTIEETEHWKNRWSWLSIPELHRTQSSLSLIPKPNNLYVLTTKSTMNSKPHFKTTPRDMWGEPNKFMPMHHRTTPSPKIISRAYVETTEKELLPLPYQRITSSVEAFGHKENRSSIPKLQ